MRNRVTFARNVFIFCFHTKRKYSPRMTKARFENRRARMMHASVISRLADSQLCIRTLSTFTSIYRIPQTFRLIILARSFLTFYRIGSSRSKVLINSSIRSSSAPSLSNVDTRCCRTWSTSICNDLLLVKGIREEINQRDGHIR